MTELLPSLQADRIRTGLVDYLSTTFALADAEPREALSEFLQHPDDGIFKGPYVRLRLPFHTVDERAAKPLDWEPPFPPYRHQHEAYQRLTSKDLGPHKPRPLPTIVTTGTGSGKTEAFLNPVIDHVLRARRNGVSGMKALILYPMNALADDQASRLTKLIRSDPELSRVTAGLYTGDAREGQGQGRSQVTDHGLITNRTVLRDDPPDILLTNYKMLDQLLLRPEDAPLWAKSALSLTYLVLDEFHTYDGAQGTDVAMLLRRLGLRLRSHVPDDHPEKYQFEERPLGRLTPVATSATLGDGSDPRAMLAFAEQVFGEPFPREAAITERRLDAETHSENPRTSIAAHGLTPQLLGSMLSSEVQDFVELARTHRDDGDRLLDAVARALYGPEPIPSDVDAPTLLRAHDDVRALIDEAAEATHIATLAAARFGASVPAPLAQAAIATVLAALSHVRLHDRTEVSVEITLWVRELSRLDRVVSDEASFRWSDDGVDVDNPVPALPALYCRSCGRSGWGVALTPTGRDLTASDENIRGVHMWGSGRFRALLHAPGEDTLVAEKKAAGEANPEQHVPNLRWLDMGARTILTKQPSGDGSQVPDQPVLPIMMLDGDTEDIEKQSKDDTCPSCGKRDQIRFLGSAIATQLSVTLSTLFGDSTLDDSEKRALVFTDSVQDAAHRAGFVDIRSHALSLRTALRDGLTEPLNLVDWTEQVMRRADRDGFARYRLVHRTLVEHELFRDYWQEPDASRIPARSTTAVRRRLLFDIEQEVGMRASYGRTLEATGSVAVQVFPGRDERLVKVARDALTGDDQALFDAPFDDRVLLRWVRVVLERLRRDGAIDHEWLQRYVSRDGDRYSIWGGRRRDQGQPAFGRGVGAPAFAVVGSAVDPRGDLVRVTSPQSWYALWAQKCLGVSGSHGASLSAQLLKLLASAEVLSETVTEKASRAYGIPATNIVVSPLTDDDLRTSTTRLVCDTCRSLLPTSPALGELLVDGPCPTNRCVGRLSPSPQDPDSFYRRLYATADMRRVDAHEHTSLIEAAERRRIEGGFKRKVQEPGDPNVLVATPTLEMGIDIGDLTTVMLSSLPDSVAKYLQRVGRAGRLTGSSMALAYVTGRGDQLPRLGDPTSMINGSVRPPATYLDAEEILRRQYFAFVIDDMVRRGAAKIPGHTGTLLKSADSGTFLADVINHSRQYGHPLVQQFIDTFPNPQTVGLESLKAWADPSASGDDTMTATIYRTVVGFQREMEELRRRRKEVFDSIPDLRDRAALPAASDEDKTAYRAAIGTRKLLDKVIHDMVEEPWIGGLEMRGLLPNYSLLDDKVELDVQMSWIDPDSGKFDSDSMVLDRGSARALTELAPGTWFYARGMQMQVDGIEVGQDSTEVQTHALCDHCGYLETLKDPAAASPSACVRCGSTGIADTGQRFSAVRLRRVFSDIRRDDALIDDGHDDRRRARFEVLAAVDFDPARRVAQWAVEEVGLEVSHYRRHPVRWFNMGRSTNAPSSRLLAGRDLAAPMFRVCEACGKLDKDAGTNSAREHRAWCPHRQAVTEHTREIALGRELVTQGVALALPPSVTGDRHSVPSLQAALLLGLRETMGGSPDHLRIEVVPHPLGTGDGQTREALFLHDVVPGGTGYLTDMASPERLWAVLVRAARVLEDCPCSNENRASCHRCLLPFSNRAEVTRRDAIRALHAVLGLPEEESFGTLDAEAPAWAVVQGAVDPGWGESPFEQKFRTAMADRLKSTASVKEKTGPNGPELRIGIGGREWTMRPQVLLHGTRPDFMLEPNGGTERIAIYTDGHTYHASGAVNRLADDARKRETLRVNGIRVVSVQWKDVSEPTTPTWLNGGVIAALMKQPVGAAISQAVVQELDGGALALLEGILREPVSNSRTALANCLPFLLAKAPGGALARVSSGSDLLPVAQSMLAGEAVSPEPIGERLITYTRPHLVLVARMSGLAATDAVLILDDSEDAIADEDHADSWREWLLLSNVLGLSDVDARITVRSIANEELAAPVVSVTSQAWDGVDLDGLSPEMQAVAGYLAAAGVTDPEVFAEVGDGVMGDMIWRSDKVALLDNESPDTDVDELRTAGWTVVRLTADDLSGAVDLVRSALADVKG